MASGIGHSDSPETESVRVPLLEELIADSTGAGARVWADLGCAQGGLVSRLQVGRNLLVVADLPEAFRKNRTQWHIPDAALEARFWRRPVDCFLCWELLNYMRPDELGELSRNFARRASKRSKVHALIEYSGTSMCDAPGRYRLDVNGQLRAAKTAIDSVGTPRYTPKALEKSMPELQVERTMLLNNGMQEFVFSLR